MYRVSVVMLLLAGCHPLSAGNDGGIQGTGGKTFNGPPHVDLGTGDSTFTGFSDPQELALLDLHDGGWAVPVSLRASSIDGRNVQVTFQWLAGGSMGALLPPVVTSVPFVPAGDVCLALGVPVTVSGVTQIQATTVWLDVQLQDSLMRQAHTRERVTTLGGPPLPDGGALDADASTVGNDAAVGGTP